MDVLDITKIINEAYIETYDELKPSLLNKNPIITFNSGYCYEFYLILNHYFNNGKLVMTKDNMHCAIMIDDVIYDSSGIRYDNYNFREEKACDLEMIYKYFGFFAYNFREELYRKVTRKVSIFNKNSVKILKKEVKV